MLVQLFYVREKLVLSGLYTREMSKVRFPVCVQVYFHLPTLSFLATFFTLAFLASSRKAQRHLTACSWRTCSVVESWLQFDFDMGQFDVEPPRSALGFGL